LRRLRLSSHSFKRRNAGLQFLCFGPRGCRHLLHRIKFFATDKVHARNPFARTLTKAGLGLAPHARNRPGNAVQKFGKVVENAFVTLHGSGSDFGSCCRNI
jgi:hypothetical protein